MDAPEKMPSPRHMAALACDAALRVAALPPLREGIYEGGPVEVEPFVKLMTGGAELGLFKKSLLDGNVSGLDLSIRGLGRRRRAEDAAFPHMACRAVYAGRFEPFIEGAVGDMGRNA